MENHPIPQDVTGFQFKLIGNMTIKQFAYVAVGVVMAVIFYYVPGLPFLIKLPLVLLFLASGFAIAFLPIDGRPLDSMIGYFLKALIVPNQYVFHQKGRAFKFEKTPSQTVPTLPVAIPKVLSLPHAPAKKDAQTEQQHKLSEREEKEKELFEYLNEVKEEHKTTEDKKEEVFIQRLSETQQAPTYVPPHTPQILSMQNTYVSPEHIHEQPEIQATPQPAPLPVEEKLQPPSDRPLDNEESPAEEKKEAKKLQHEVADLQKELKEAQAVEADVHSSKEEATQAHKKALELENQLQEMMADRTRLEQELEHLRKQLAEQKKGKEAKAPAEEKKKEELSTVRKIPQNMAKQAGLLHVPDVPNLILGVIKDSRGNMLSNILVEVKDQEGNSVRAFKTNPLGQFASATPLNNGSYTIEFEDPSKQHKFEVVEIKAEGKILLPIEITSQDAREELRRELFA